MTDELSLVLDEARHDRESWARERAVATRTARTLAKLVLLSADGRQWTLQGFGMLRTTFEGPAGEDCRLNVWLHSHRILGVSDIHDHPWDLTSHVLAGSLRNELFEALPADPDDERNISYRWSYLKCGTGGGLHSGTPDGAPQVCRLVRKSSTYYYAGQSYSQLFEGIHATGFTDGTVTLNFRVRRLEERGLDRARVFWPDGTEWVSAEPRVATPREVSDFVDAAIERLRTEA